MIESIEVSNFRGYKNLSLSHLPQFNFLIGESGSGKTTFLESLWVVGGISPEIYFRLRALRGTAGALQLRNDRRGYETLFRDLFFDPGLSSGAGIQILDSKEGLRSLAVFYGRNQELLLEVDPSALSTASIRPIVFRWRVKDKDYTCPLTISNGQVVVPGPQPDAFPSVFIPASHVVDSAENAGRLSELSIQKKKSRILTALQTLYPDIEDLSVEIVGGQQMIYAAMSFLPQHIPVPLISSGLNKYLAIILAIHQQENGVVLVDELENGFYFKNYEAVVRGLVHFCTVNSVQLFASTHSYEMLEAIAAVMSGEEHKFCLLKTHRTADGCGVKVIEGLPSKSAIDQNMEVR